MKNCNCNDDKRKKRINKNISAIAKQTQYNVIRFTRQDYKKSHAANT